MKKINAAKLIVLLLFACFNSHAQTGWVWGKGCTPHGAAAEIDAWAAATDRAGNLFAGGVIFSADSTNFGPFTVYDPNDTSKLFVVKSDSAGNYLWVMKNQVGVALPQAMATDTAGNLYIMALYASPVFSFGSVTLTQSSPSNMYALLKVSSSGTVLWGVNVAPQTSIAVSFSHYFTNLNPTGSLGLDKDGNIYVSGTFTAASITIGSTNLYNGKPTGGVSNVFVAKYDATGSPVWAASLADKKSIVLSSTAVSADGTTYLCGGFEDTLSAGGYTLTDSLSSDSLAFLVKVNNNGHIAWATKNNQYLLKYTAVGVDATDKIYLAGYFNGSIVYGASAFTPPGAGTAYQVLIAALDSSGTVNWARAAYDTSANHKNYPYTVSVDGCGKLCITGMFEYNGAAWPTTSHYLLFGTDTLHIPAGTLDALFVAVYDTSGTYYNSEALASGGEDWDAAVADNMGNLYISDDNAINMVVGPDSLHTYAVTAEAFFIAKYHYGSACGTDVVTGVHSVNSPSLEITVFPNPAFGECTVRSNKEFGKDALVELYNMQGRLLSSYPISGFSATIPLGATAPGMYFCKILQDGSCIAVKKLMVE